jgi:hypothetical protein
LYFADCPDDANPKKTNKTNRQPISTVLDAEGGGGDDVVVISDWAKLPPIHMKEI